MTTTSKARGRPPSGGRDEILRATLELLRECGMAKLTTREVARRAGVSEGSIFYHFNDRFGLLRAVFEQSMGSLHVLNTSGLLADDVRTTLTRFSDAIRTFLESGLDVLMAAQSDVELRNAVAAYMTENNYGPHRGINGIGAYLAQQQQAGTVRADIDPKVIAYMVVNDAFQRAGLPKLIGHGKGIPPRKTFMDTLMAMIRPLPD